MHHASATGAPRRLLAGCAAGAALAAAATWLRLGLERTPRLDTGTTAFLSAALLAGLGLGLMGACALRLGRVLAGPPPRALLAWAVAVQLCAWPAAPLTSTDAYANLAQGELQRRGLSPYLDGPAALGPGPVADLVPARWARAPSPYGPVATLASRAAAGAGAALGAPLWGGLLAFKLLMLLCVLATLVLAWGEARADAADGAGRFALLACSPLLAWELSAQAHNDALLVLSLAAFVAAARRGRELPATLALAAGTLAKAAAAPLLALYLAWVARRSRARAAALAAAALALAALAVVPFWRGTATLVGPGAALGGDVERHAHSLADLLALALAPLGPLATSAAYRACWLASLVACAAVGLRALRRARSLTAVLHDGLTLFLVYDLTTPWFQPWYATWLLPLAVVEPDPALRRLVAGYALWTVVQWALPLDPVSTVAVNGWVAFAWWRTVRARREAPTLAAAA